MNTSYQPAKMDRTRKPERLIYLKLSKELKESAGVVYRLFWGEHPEVVLSKIEAIKVNVDFKQTEALRETECILRTLHREKAKAGLDKSPYTLIACSVIRDAAKLQQPKFFEELLLWNNRLSPWKPKTLTCGALDYCRYENDFVYLAHTIVSGSSEKPFMQVEPRVKRLAQAYLKCFQRCKRTGYLRPSPFRLFAGEFKGGLTEHGLRKALADRGIKVSAAPTGIESLNRLLRGRTLHRRFKDVALPQTARDLLAREPDLSVHDYIELNRHILEAAFPAQCPKHVLPGQEGSQKDNLTEDELSIVCHLIGEAVPKAMIEFLGLFVNNCSAEKPRHLFSKAKEKLIVNIPEDPEAMWISGGRRLNESKRRTLCCLALLGTENVSTLKFARRYKDLKTIKPAEGDNVFNKSMVALGKWSGGVVGYYCLPGSHHRLVYGLEFKIKATREGLEMFLDAGRVEAVG